jgi:hypothetical protein
MGRFRGSEEIRATKVNLIYYNKSMAKDWARKIIVPASLVGLAMANFAFGATASPITLPNPLSTNSFQQVVANVSNFLLLIATPLVAIMALIGGFQMITAAGNPEKFASGRKTLMYAVIGFAVVLIAGGVAQIIKNFLGSSS